MRFTSSILAACLMLAPTTAFAQEKETAAQSQSARPAATMADMVWLEGRWQGTGIGGHPAGETFTFAGEQQMVGHFWQLDESGGIEFYELITVVPDGDSLTMRLKHFTGDLTGWEAQAGNAALEFPLRERSAGRWQFGPVTFTLDGPGKLAIAVVTRNGEGALDTLEFRYDRVTPD